MYTVGDFYDALEQIAPFATSESWDNTGLLVGGRGRPVEKALLALDLTGPVLAEAVELGAGLVVTHHPVIFRPLARLDDAGIAYRAVAAGISVLSAHTNLDLADGGVNDALAGRLGLRNTRPLASTGDGPGLGRLGQLPGPLAPDALAALVKERLGASGVRFVAGREPVTAVAVCGGSGADLIYEASAAGAQALVTGEGKHNLWLEAAELGLTLIDAGHFATENPVMAPLVERLAALLPGADLHLSQRCTDGVRFL